MADPFAYGVEYLSTTLGLPREVTRGAVNYMYRNESKLDPMATNPTSGAFGIAQYLGSRKKALLAKFGSAPTVEQQYEHIVDELKSGSDGGNTLAQLQKAAASANPEKAAYDVWGRAFERPGSAALAKAGVGGTRYTETGGTRYAETGDPQFKSGLGKLGVAEANLPAAPPAPEEPDNRPLLAALALQQQGGFGGFGPASLSSALTQGMQPAPVPPQPILPSQASIIGGPLPLARRLT